MRKELDEISRLFINENKDTYLNISCYKQKQVRVEEIINIKQENCSNFGNLDLKIC